MNLATPILIFHLSEDFRSLLRDMLGKHGFFHVLEATSAEEVQNVMKKEGSSLFLLMQGDLLNESIMSKLKANKNFLVFVQQEENKTLSLAARLGLSHLVTFPFSSQSLLQKIKSIVQ